MMTTEALLADLRAAHPDLHPQLFMKIETALVDDETIPTELVAVVVDEMLIYDLFASSCGRFEVDPDETYGVPLPFALRIAEHNGIERRRYQATWDNLFLKPGSSEVPPSFFNGDNGYDVVDVDAIGGLALGEEWISSDFGAEHTVTRVA